MKNSSKLHVVSPLVPECDQIFISFQFFPGKCKSGILHSQFGEPTVPGVFRCPSFPCPKISAIGMIAYSALLFNV